MLIAIYNLLKKALGLSTETDPEGNNVLRVVDAAPFAYDPVLGTNKVSLVASKKVVNLGNIGSTETLPATNGTKAYKLQPPPGKIWKILFLYFEAPAISGATSGIHKVSFRYGADVSVFDLLVGTTAHSKLLTYRVGEFTSTVDTKLPDDAYKQSTILTDILITNSIPLYIKYENKSDVETTSNIQLRVMCSEEDEL